MKSRFTEYGKMLPAEGQAHAVRALRTSVEAFEAAQKRSGKTKTVGLAEDRAGEAGWEWGCGGPEGQGLADRGILRAGGGWLARVESQPLPTNPTMLQAHQPFAPGGSSFMKPKYPRLGFCVEFRS